MTTITYVYTKNPSIPKDVLGFSINTGGKTSVLQWVPEVIDPDLSHYTIRHNISLTNATWANSQVVIDKVPSNATSVTVPTVQGSYLIKAVDYAGFESINAAILTVDTSLDALNILENIDELSTVSSGSTIDAEYDGNIISLAGQNISNWSNLTEVSQLTFGSDLAPGISPIGIGVGKTYTDSSRLRLSTLEIADNISSSALWKATKVPFEIYNNKYYFEVLVDTLSTSAMVGISTNNTAGTSYAGGIGEVSLYLSNGTLYYNNTTDPTYAPALVVSQGSVVGVEVDLKVGTIEFFVDGLTLGKPSTITSDILLGGTYWSSNTAVLLNQLIAGDNCIYKVTTAGTLGSIAPDHYEGSNTNGTAVLQFYSKKPTWYPTISTYSYAVPQASISNNVLPLPTYHWDFTRGMLPPDLVFTRASTKLAFNSQGVLSSLPIDTPSFSYDDNGNCTGIRLDGFYTNFWLYSKDLSNAAYTKVGGTIASDISPTGTSSPIILVMDNSTGVHSIQNSPVARAASSTQTVKVFIKPYEITECQVSLIGSLGSTYTNNINLSTGTITFVSNTGYTAYKTYPLIFRKKYGWYEFNLSVVLPATAENLSLKVSAVSAGLTNFTGVTGHRLGIYGLQISGTTSVTPPIETTNSLVSTSADTLTRLVGFSTSGTALCIRTDTDSSSIRCINTGTWNTSFSISDDNTNYLNTIMHQYTGGLVNTRSYSAITGSTAISPSIASIKDVLFSKVLLGAAGAASRSTYYGNSTAIGTQIGTTDTTVFNSLATLTSIRFGAGPNNSSNLFGVLRSCSIYAYDPLDYNIINYHTNGSQLYPFNRQDFNLRFDPSAWQYTPTQGFKAITNGLKSWGVYNFKSMLDLGRVLSSDVTSMVNFTSANLKNTLDAWTILSNINDMAGTNAKDTAAFIEYSSSTDNITWTGWSKLFTGTITARYLKFRLILTSLENIDTPIVDMLKVVVDMPDLIQQGADLGITTPLSTYNIVFTTPFMIIPAIAINMQGMSTGDYYLISNKTINGFDISFFNSSNTPVARSFDWTAKGY